MTNAEILRNLSSDCKPVKLNCDVLEAMDIWLSVTTFRERLHLELIIEQLSDGGCEVYIEDWSDFDDIDHVNQIPYISIIFICLFLGAICLS